MKKLRKIFIPILMTLIMLSVMPINVYAEEENRENYAYLEVTYPNGDTLIFDVSEKPEESDDKIISIYTDEFPMSLKLYGYGIGIEDWDEEYTFESYGEKQLVAASYSHRVWSSKIRKFLGYARVEIKPTAQKLEDEALAAQKEKEKETLAAQEKTEAEEEERIEQRNENFKIMFENAGITSYSADWYIEHDLEEFINGQWAGDKKEDSTMGDRYIYSRKYVILKPKNVFSVSLERYEFNLDYSGSLEKYDGELYTLAVSKKDNIIYCWQFFECLDQWQIPKTEIITNVYVFEYPTNECYGSCTTKDNNGNKYSYLLEPGGEFVRIDLNY